MSGILDPGGVIDALFSVLQANLAAKFNVLDTEYGDSIVLNDVASTDYWRAFLGNYDSFPCIVAVTEVTIPEDQAAAFWIQTHTVALSFYETSIEAVDSLLPPEVAVVRVQRSLRAIQEVIVANQTLTVSAVDKAMFCGIDGIAYGAVEDTPDSQFIYAGTLNLQITVNYKG